ncbi:YnbE family lipoprotein [Sphingomicrobium marinum]|uniref:YnbE family lipoprotein n=1 Tax=Sphingomicrobium marinum TaxID=1227950 RepID=UPI00223EE21B|nr:YnbE family lipoprotein [Sphingomicrobium marinum]
MKRLVILPALLGLGGCVTLEQPEKPIDINLNVKIEQEVLVRLDREVDALISENPEAFPVANEAEEPQ